MAIRVSCKAEALCGALCNVTGGEKGIRTPDRLLTYTRFPGVRLKPLIHLSEGRDYSKSLSICYIYLIFQIYLIFYIYLALSIYLYPQSKKVLK